MRVGGQSSDTTIGDCLQLGWGLALTCAGCGRRARWGLDRLQGLPPGVTLADLAARVRCEACGGSEGVLGPVNAQWHPGRA